MPQFCDDLLFNISATYYLFVKMILYNKQKERRIEWQETSFFQQKLLFFLTQYMHAYINFAKFAK